MTRLPLAPAGQPLVSARVLRQSRIVLYSFLPVLLTLAFLGGVGESASRIVLVVLGFSAVIFVHELGHFVAARLCSVKTEVFSIGIGPRMVGWKKGVGLSFGSERVPAETPTKAHAEVIRDIDPFTGDLQQTATDTSPSSPATAPTVGECDYRLSWLPLGGYVRMLGQDDMDPTNLSRDPRAFNNRPIYQRMIIISAGVLMNLLFAAVVFAAIFRVGVGFPPAVIGEVSYGGPAYEAGLRPGDRVLLINGEKPRDGFLEFMDLAIASALSRPGEKITLEVQRGSEQLRFEVEPKTGDRGLRAIGVAPMQSLALHKLEAKDTAQLADVPAELTKIRAGDRVTKVLKIGERAVNETLPTDPVEAVVAFDRLVQASGGQAMEIQLTNDDPKVQPREIALTLQPLLGGVAGVKEHPALLGLYPYTRIEQVLDGPAKDAGFAKGDLIVRVGSQLYPTIPQFRTTIERSAGQNLQVAVRRGEELRTLEVTPKRGPSGNGLISVAMGYHFDEPVIASVDPAAGERLLRIHNNARLLAARMAPDADFTPLATWHDLLRLARAPENAGKTLELQIRDPLSAPTTATAPATASAPAATEAIVVSIALTPAETAALTDKLQYELPLPRQALLQTQHSDSVLGAVSMGMSHTKKYIIQTYLTIRGLFMRTIPLDQLHGPLGIAKIGYDAQEQGATFALFVLAMVSVNLAVANFLPLPIVDGGLFILLLIEKIRGKPLPLKVLSVINIVGLCLLVGLFLYVTLNNDRRLLFGW